MMAFVHLHTPRALNLVGTCKPSSVHLGSNKENRNEQILFVCEYARRH